MELIFLYIILNVMVLDKENINISDYFMAIYIYATMIISVNLYKHRFQVLWFPSKEDEGYSVLFLLEPINYITGEETFFSTKLKLNQALNIVNV